MPTEVEVRMAELDRTAADLIQRAALLDSLAGDIARAAQVLDYREREIAMRENDVLRASLKLAQWRRERKLVRDREYKRNKKEQDNARRLAG